MCFISGYPFMNACVRARVRERANCQVVVKDYTARYIFDIDRHIRESSALLQT